MSHVKIKPAPCGKSQIVRPSREAAEAAIRTLLQWAGDDPERVRECMSGHLCRCGAYLGITQAVLEAQKALDAADVKEVA